MELYRKYAIGLAKEEQPCSFPVVSIEHTSTCIRISYALRFFSTPKDFNTSARN